MSSDCFVCEAEPAGNEIAGPYAAYCAGCQPQGRKGPSGSQCMCASCGLLFATVTDFDKHQARYPQRHPQEGVFTGICLEPAAAGLERAGLVYGTPAGNANRARKSRDLAAARLSRRP